MNTKINDFGNKIGGAKKDLAAAQIDLIKNITNDALLKNPLSKIFPRPDFRKMYQDGLISDQTAIDAQFLYNSIENKPRASYYLPSWVNKTKLVIEAIGLMLSTNQSACKELKSERYTTFLEEMKSANWPVEEYNTGRLLIERSYTGKDFWVLSGKFIKFRGSMDECVAYVKTSSGQRKERKLSFDIFQSSFSKKCFITPKGKKNVVLMRDLDIIEAKELVYKDSEKLEKIYCDLRNVPELRRDWNRPRQGFDFRDGLDVSPELFHEIFRFYGVEFGNWVTQIERAGCLNEGFDALKDFCSVLRITPENVTLSGTLSLAFGARGSGKANAHYERNLRVINLTKTKGSGCLAHEWFHALDNYLSIVDGDFFGMATERTLSNEGINVAMRALVNAVTGSGMPGRSETLDGVKGKKYYALVPEMLARAFESYVLNKLSATEQINDYLVNITSYADFSRPEVYPYPTDDESAVFAPLFDDLLSAVFGEPVNEPGSDHHQEKETTEEGAAADEPAPYSESQKSQILINSITSQNMKPIFSPINEKETRAVIRDRVFAITGTLTHERKYFAEYITSQGGEVSPRVNDTVDVLIAGPDAVEGAGTAKVIKAEDLGIPIIRESDFLEATGTCVELVVDATPTPPRAKPSKAEEPAEIPAYIATAANPLNGQTFSITGTLGHSRKQFERFIKKNDGRFIREVSSAVHYLIAGPDAQGTAKLERARGMGTRILSEAEFLQLAGVAGVM